MPFETQNFDSLNSKLRNTDGKFYLKSEVFKKDSKPSFFQKLKKKKVFEPSIENILCQNVFLLTSAKMMNIITHSCFENIWFNQLWKLNSSKLLSAKNINIIFAKFMKNGADLVRYQKEQPYLSNYFEKNGFYLILEIIIKVYSFSFLICFILISKKSLLKREESILY